MAQSDYAPAKWEPAPRQARCERQRGKAGEGSGQAEEEAGREKRPEQQAGTEHAQQRYPGGIAPAVVDEDDQGNDVAQSRFHAGQRQRYCGLGDRQRDCHGAVARDAVIVRIGREHDLSS